MRCRADDGARRGGSRKDRFSALRFQPQADAASAEKENSPRRLVTAEKNSALGLANGTRYG